MDYFHPLGFSEELRDLTAEVGLVILTLALLFAGFAIWLNHWRREHYDGGFADHGHAKYHAWAMHHQEYRGIEKWRHAILELIINLERRTTSDWRSWLPNIWLTLLAVFVFPGITFTAICIIKLAASEALPAHPNAGDATRDWLNRF